MSHCEAKTGRAERKKQRPSSEMLKRKRRSSSGSQAPAPEKRFKRGSPVEQLRERSREGRKETNRKPSTKTGKECMRNQAGENGEAQEAKAEREHRGSHCEAETGRTERKKKRLSSRKWRRSGRKEAEGKRKIRKAKAGSKHLRNSCGSESGKGERKHTGALSTGTGVECTGNQAGENGEDRRSESENGALLKPL